MSSAYIVQANESEEGFRRLAGLLSAQMSSGDESVNHYSVADGLLLGAVSRDTFHQGVMPQYLPSEQLWGLLLGTLYCSDSAASMNSLLRFARLYRQGTLEEELRVLNGAFFVALWDPERQTLVAANDRFGLYPMYWAHNGGRFCLAGRVLCSVLAGTVAGEWDRAGVAQLLTTNDFVGEGTHVVGVSAFPQATMMVKTGFGAPTWRRYWHYDYEPRHEGKDVREIGRELGARLIDGVRRQTAGIGRVGVTLSGGLDSRCIAAAANSAGVPVRTFTWGDPGCFDRQFARDTARMFQMRHGDHDYSYPNYEAQYEEVARTAEALGNGFDAHMLTHLHILQGEIDLVLNGYAGDLILGGSYLRGRWMSDLPEDALSAALFGARNVALPEAALSSAMVGMEHLEPDRMPYAQHRQQLEAIRGLATPDRVDRFFLENRVRRHTSVGTVMMRCGVESAAAFFDYDLVDYTTGIPAALRREHRAYLAMMRECFPEALKVRWQRTLLPAGAPTWCAMASKGFLKGCRVLRSRFGWPIFTDFQSPVRFSEQLRGPLRAWMEALCTHPHPVADEVLQPEFCERIWSEHLLGADRTLLLGTIAALRQFSRALGDARRKKPARSSAPREVTAQGAPSPCGA